MAIKKQQNILIVEDDRSLNRGIGLVFRNDDMDIRQAYDLKTAGEIFSVSTLDLIILDINLPDGSGLDFCKTVRASSTVPIVFLTANDLELDIVTGFELGGDDYITKPFSLMVLRVRVMAQLLESAWAESEYIDENALTVTIKRLRGKIEDDPSSPVYIKTVYGLGYMWTGGV
jgi:DNA-binding response OmpR family regulator